MKAKIKIAHITKDLKNNGISMLIYNYCKNIDKKEFKITIIAGSPVSSLYYDKLRNLGVELIEIPKKIKNPKKYYLSLLKLLDKKKYDEVHIHGNSATLTIELIIAYIKGIKVRFVHCHNSNCEHIKIHKLLKPLFNKFYTYGFACSSIAGKWLFTKDNYVIIPNGIDINKFIFDQKSRNEIRRKLNIENNQLLIGHVGRFNSQKNHIFLLEIFEYIAKLKKDVKLLLVGNGPDYEKIKRNIEEHEYKKRIILYGETDEVEKLYSAMDIFVFPSKCEGLGIVLIEAQVSGLKCIVSNAVPNEAYITDNVLALELGDAEKWATAILNTELKDRNKFQITNREYDIKENVKILENYYRKFYSNKGVNL